MDCLKFDGQVVRLEKISDIASEFVRARLIRISGADLNTFEFDWDLTWAAFFMNASGKIYGRYGGRDAKGPDTRNSLEGLRFAMESALEAHRRDPYAKPDPPAKPPLYVEKLSSARYVGGCIHCHQVKELLRQEAKNAGTWTRDSVYTYPLPENIGITLDANRGNLIRSVKAQSPAAAAGIEAGDVLQSLNGQSIHSFADAQHALHKAAPVGALSISWTRDGIPATASLTLTQGWKWTNLTWRPSLLDLLPSLTAYGDDLSDQEKRSLGLSPRQLAFRQERPVHSAARDMGIQERDIIIGVDGRKLEMGVDRFLGFIRQNYLVGEEVTFNMIRNGKRMDLRAMLK